MWKMLIVDDEDLIREGMRDCIDWASESVVIAGEARDGREALEKVRTQKPHFVLVDVVMPGMDGLAFLKEARIIDEDLTVIFISAHEEFDYVHTALHYRAVDYLLKPVHIPDLLKILRKQIKKKEAREMELSRLFKLESTLSYHRDQIRERFIYDLFTGKVTSGMIREQIAVLEWADRPKVATRSGLNLPGIPV